MKHCTKCQQLKPLSDFTKDKQKKIGYSSHCKECRNSWIREYQRRPEVKAMRMEKIKNKEQRSVAELTKKKG